MKKLTSLFLALIMLLTLSLSFTALAEEEVIELNFLRIGTDAPENEYWHWVIEGFEAENPGIKINYSKLS